MKRILYFSMLWLLLSNGNAMGQTVTFKTADEAKSLSKAVAIRFQENKIADAYGLLKPYLARSEQEFKINVTGSVNTLNVLTKDFGVAESIIKVSEHGIKETGLREVYLVKYEKTALRLIFTYYKNSKAWILYDFKWDSDFDDEFK